MYIVVLCVVCAVSCVVYVISCIILGVSQAENFVKIAALRTSRCVVTKFVPTLSSTSLCTYLLPSPLAHLQYPYMVLTPHLRRLSSPASDWCYDMTYICMSDVHM